MLFCILSSKEYIRLNLLPQGPVHVDSSQCVPMHIIPMQGLSGLASLNASVGGEQRVEEAVELWREAIASTRTTADSVDPSASGEGRVDGNESSSGGGDGGNQDGVTRNLLLCRASVLCSAAQGELLLDRGTANASNHLAEALQLREDLLPSNHPAKVRSFVFVSYALFSPGPRCRVSDSPVPVPCP